MTAGNISWEHVMCRFREIWKSIKERHEADDPSTLQISKQLLIMKWIEAFSNLFIVVSSSI